LKRGVAKLVKDYTQGEWILLGIGAAIILILIVGGYRD
jgi:hypothetical protein